MISRADCQALATYHAPPGVDYQPGVDVNGHPVAPADLPGGSSYQLPGKVEFDILLNPLNSIQGDAKLAAKYANTAMPVGHVVVDTRTGEVSLNGQPLQSGQEQYLTDVCRQAGY